MYVNSIPILKNTHFHGKELKSEKITMIATHLEETSGPLLVSLSIRRELLLQGNKAASDDKESDKDEDVWGETWSTEYTESEETSSSDGASLNESDGSDSEHAQSPAKRGCYTRSGRNATSFVFH